MALRPTSDPSDIRYFANTSPHQRDGYIVKDEAPKNYGRSDITVYEHRRTPRGTLIRHRFLIVQCKRVSFETQDAVWAEAEEQLEEYLAATHKRTRPANRTPVYGAVAVGRRIGFYKYNHNSKEMCANTMIPDTSSLP